MSKLDGYLKLIKNSFGALSDEWKEIKHEQQTLAEAREVFSQFISISSNPDFAPTDNEVRKLEESVKLIIANGSQSEAGYASAFVSEFIASRKTSPFDDNEIPLIDKLDTLQ